ncbi:MAG: 3-phosphoshikimate 1-carboxyvinyltransferase [Planctomycetia bacterium]|nr:3-phosphoshikimate 1-carboxyvinyltransferase [Planctomycetia bacterium]
MNLIEIFPISDVEAIVEVPGSKSITNRALMIAALSQGKNSLTGVLDSEDTQIMIEALKTLGVDVLHNPLTHSVEIDGKGGCFPNQNAEIYVGNSGTTARFLTAALACSQGTYRLFGKPRMHERPLGDLLQAIRHLGGSISSEHNNDCLPIIIQGKQGLKGKASIAGNVSSQFLSALLLTGGMNNVEMELTVQNELVSHPYIKMTLAIMKSFGVNVETDASLRHFKLNGRNQYQPIHYRIEPDASAASYFFAVPAIVGGKITVRHLSRQSLQGDVQFVDCLAAMGCLVYDNENEITVERPRLNGKLKPLVGIDVDMNDISDTVQTLSVVALFAESPTRIRNVAHIRHKETDRIAAVVHELKKLGTRVEEYEDGLTIWPNANRQQSQKIIIETYDDHRMAMSFALAGLALPNIFIKNPECSKKTYPQFFDDLNKLQNNQPN